MKKFHYLAPQKGINAYIKFIKGKIFTNKDISKILIENKINAQVIDIKYYQFKKIYIKTIENNKIFFLKLCLLDI